jgi:hypothetical protein
MSTLASSLRPSLLEWARPLLLSRTLWCVGFIALFLARPVLTGFAELTNSLGDTDDATRLVQLRAYMQGASWYDLVLSPLGGATPLLSHWSRLIDVPLALLVAVFGLFVVPETAELAARVAWPTLLLFAFIRLMVAEIDKQSGPIAAGLLLVLTFTCINGLVQFRPGRIDHHNAMILGCVVGLLVMVRAFETPRAGWFAGALLGCALVIGYEPLALIVPLVALAAVAGAVHAPMFLGARNVVVALAATLCVGFVVSVPPERWFDIKCDAVSLNMVALALSGAAGMALIKARGEAWSAAMRVGVLAAAGAVGLILYTIGEPACLGGPFGQVDQLIRPIWLDHVQEGRSIWWLIKTAPTTGLPVLLFIAVGVFAAVQAWRRAPSSRSFGLMAVMVCAALTPALQLKFIPYPGFVAAFAIAIWLAQWRGTAQLTPLSVRLLGVFAFNQLTATLLVTAMLSSGGSGGTSAQADASGMDACKTNAAVRSLADLPIGLVVSHLDIGPYIAALTPHAALAAPYHRLDASIIATQAIFEGDISAAEQTLRRVGATYVVQCIQPGAARDPDLPTASVLGRMIDGANVAFLEPVVLPPSAGPLKAWRVAPTR